MTESGILENINAILPKGVDWRAGAIEYLRAVAAAGDYSDGLAKPFRKLTPASPPSAHREVGELLENFVNVFTILNLQAGSTILDVACGSGWLAHMWARLGFQAYGFDICGDFIESARERVRTDPLLDADPETMFFCHDIETAPLQLPVQVDAAIFESCFHHFYNPVQVLRNVSAALSSQGVAILIEGESQVLPEHQAVMHKYRTIERPYTRDQMIQILEAAGMPYYVFFGPVNGWIPQGYTQERELLTRLSEQFDAQNRCICARTEAAIHRLVPDWEPARSFELGEGFYTGSRPGYWWCAPHAILRITRDCSLQLQVGGTTGDQSIIVYGSKGKIMDLKLNAVKVISLPHLKAGEVLHLCSEAAFSPAWGGESDSRILSFWISEVQVF